MTNSLPSSPEEPARASIEEHYRDVLHERGQHLPACRVWQGKAFGCDCGLTSPARASREGEADDEVQEDLRQLWRWLADASPVRAEKAENALRCFRSLRSRLHAAERRSEAQGLRVLLYGLNWDDDMIDNALRALSEEV